MTGRIRSSTSCMSFILTSLGIGMYCSFLPKRPNYFKMVFTCCGSTSATTALSLASFYTRFLFFGGVELESDGFLVGGFFAGDEGLSSLRLRFGTGLS